MSRFGRDAAGFVVYRSFMNTTPRRVLLIAPLCLLLTLAGCATSPARSSPTTTATPVERADRVVLQAALQLEEIAAEPGASPCDVEDEKLYIGKQSEEGMLCRDRAYVDYLLDVVACSLAPNAEECCEEALADYCAVFDNCPP